MRIDLGVHQESQIIPEYDLCIIGSGPAGLTVVNEMKNSGLKIAVLESGKLKNTEHFDRLRRVVSKGIKIKEYSRERIFGGASTTWSGLSSHLDVIDFEERSYVPFSGWPISRDELMSYYKKAADNYGFPVWENFQNSTLEKIRAKNEIQLNWQLLDEKIFLAASPAQNFAKIFHNLFENSNIDLYLDATVIKLEGDAAEAKIKEAVIRSSNDREYSIKAKIFVLATGGIENARLLLQSKSLCTQGLGNEHDQVGRYLMNHPKNSYGVVTFQKPLKELPYYFGFLFNNTAGYAGLRLAEKIQKEKTLLNSYVRFEPLFPWSNCPGVEAIIIIVQNLKAVMRIFQRLKKGRVISLRDYSETGDDSELQNIRRNFWQWLGMLALVLIYFPKVSRYLTSRILEGNSPPIRKVRLRNFMEMQPSPDNRVTLSQDRDVYGQPMPIVTHFCSELDKKSLVALHRCFKEEIRRQGLGEFHSNLEKESKWPIDSDASHHIGTTRMGKDSRTSVVNSDCRVHSVNNLYIAGCSVFPTSGCANPTFTIVALAIRLGEHLKFLGAEERT